MEKPEMFHDGELNQEHHHHDNHSTKMEKVELMIQLPPECLSLVDIVAGNNSALRKRLNAYHGTDMYACDYHDVLEEKGKEQHRDDEWGKMIVSLPLLLVQCIDDLNTVMGKTREWLASCFIIEGVMNLYVDPHLIAEWWNEKGTFLDLMNARLHLYGKRNGTRNGRVKNDPEEDEP